MLAPNHRVMGLQVTWHLSQSHSGQWLTQDWLVLKENIQGPAMSHMGDDLRRNLEPRGSDEDVAWGMRVEPFCSRLCQGPLAPVRGEKRQHSQLLMQP